MRSPVAPLSSGTRMVTECSAAKSSSKEWEVSCHRPPSKLERSQRASQLALSRMSGEQPKCHTLTRTAPPLHPLFPPPRRVSSNSNDQHATAQTQKASFHIRPLILCLSRIVAATISHTCRRSPSSGLVWPASKPHTL
eukprot:7379107-Prymnesium_polylepis.1